MALERDAPGGVTVFSCRPGRCAPHLSRSASCVYVRVSMKFMIKSAEPKDEHFLWQMLYEAAHMDEAGEPVEAAKHNPALARYVAHWGQEHDVGYIAIDPDTGQMVAAAWFRLLHGANKGYGYVSDKVPELAIGTRPAYRGQGAGTALMEALIQCASPGRREAGARRASSGWGSVPSPRQTRVCSRLPEAYARSSLRLPAAAET